MYRCWHHIQHILGHQFSSIHKSRHHIQRNYAANTVIYTKAAATGSNIYAAGANCPGAANEYIYAEHHKIWWKILWWPWWWWWWWWWYNSHHKQLLKIKMWMSMFVSPCIFLLHPLPTIVVASRWVRRAPFLTSLFVTCSRCCHLLSITKCCTEEKVMAWVIWDGDQKSDTKWTTYLNPAPLPNCPRIVAKAVVTTLSEGNWQWCEIVSGGG